MVIFLLCPSLSPLFRLHDKAQGSERPLYYLAACLGFNNESDFSALMMLRLTGVNVCSERQGASVQFHEDCIQYTFHT